MMGIPLFPERYKSLDSYRSADSSVANTREDKKTPNQSHRLSSGSPQWAQSTSKTATFRRVLKEQAALQERKKDLR
ncbi:uncharacterized protein LOC100116895 isoform X2 [Nasonia vitripennis]|uniref:Uncharacterized protein n=1 Tax=Nasonia vitripennis TaxID=7425 RepID=A0A7M7QV67_NASVI|nr:uncharacterized protein LOC100116895 isoform X2 [Nasonia vitripennis]XP_031779533.1 uncharacterized protein LOC100116895 isoform X2 [Nasonia vitripennis]XP_032453278.1 uncharacterized protein LOC100116895 isoform X2 [Nasonia vitripennis]XP_032453280.1 uncharacterized protein LOC100116895 isoform X2 [Nasonia vitripennis]